MVLFGNFKYFALLFSALLHIMLLCGSFFSSNSNFHYAIKPQVSSGLSFKISSQNNIVKQVSPTQNALNKKATVSKNSQQNKLSHTQNTKLANSIHSSSIIAPQFEAEYLNNTPPNYPASAKRMGIEGEVILLVVVQENGLPAEINIHQSSGFAILDESAILAVKKWQFVSAKQNGKNIRASVLVPIKFQLT
jgi:TonB family protein